MEICILFLLYSVQSFKFQLAIKSVKKSSEQKILENWYFASFVDLRSSKLIVVYKHWNCPLADKLPYLISVLDNTFAGEQEGSKWCESNWALQSSCNATKLTPSVCCAPNPYLHLQRFSIILWKKTNAFIEQMMVIFVNKSQFVGIVGKGITY